ncbi:l-amino acid oxidase [Fusarium heterosporum]|uniref:L-amino acid oxidase n=1 Tax=Fusarium heterosporum TaxID=42747 RepID=A0A8H5WDY5_FUSHE|nr:l-amino acid oxidase [Fusarium heterosporum]
MNGISMDLGVSRQPSHPDELAELAVVLTQMMLSRLSGENITPAAHSIVPPKSLRSCWANRLVREKLCSELVELNKRGIPFSLLGLEQVPVITPYNLPPDPAYRSGRKGHGISVTTAACAVTEPSLPPRKVCIVGAGIAGLYIAMILDDLQIPNLEYEILEASDRVGGRVYTHRFSEKKNDYYDIGAMRYPDIPTMQRTFDLFKRTDVHLLKYHFKGSNCPKLFNDRPFTAATRDPYGVSVSRGGFVPDDVVDNAEGILEDIYGPFKRAMAENFEIGFRCLMAVDHFSTREYLRRGGHNGLGRCFDFHSIQWLETQSTSTNLFDQAFSESVMDSCDFNGCGEEVEWHCIKGGTGKVIEAMETRIRGKVETGKRVRKMTLDQSSQAEDNMTVHVAGEPEPRAGYMTIFNTTTLGCLSRMDTSGLALHPVQKEAIRSLHYDESAKIALQFSYPWWIVDCGIREGGCSSTDLPLRTCIYPSYNIDDGEDKPAILLASYTWAQDATRLGSMIANRRRQAADPEEHPPSEQELVELILQNLARLHAGKITYEKIKASFTGKYHAWAWQNDPFSAGAFALFGPGQFSNLYPYLTRPAADSKFHIVGEAASVNHGWVVGSLDSAYSAVYKFLYRFGLWSHLQRLVDRWGQVGEVEDGEHGTVHLQVALGMLRGDPVRV